MAGGSVGTIFAELDLDASRYTKAQQKLLQDATHTTLNIEQNFKSLGVKSSAEMDLMRAKITNSFNAIANSSKATANDILRAEQAKNDQLKRLDEQQFGRQTSLIEGVKKNWLAAAAVIGTAMVAASKAWDLVKMGADFEEQRGILDNLGKKYNTTADQIVSSMEKASDGLVSRADLMQVALGGLAKGLDPTQLNNLSDAARILGDVVGKDATTALKDLSEALESGKTKALKGYLGTAIDLEATFGKLYEKMTEAEKAQALYNITMIEAGKLQGAQTKAVDETADSIERLETRWKNLNTTMSQWAKAGFVSLADTIDRLAGGNLTPQDVITDNQGRQFVYEKNTFGGDLDDIANPKGAATSDAYQKALDAMKKKVAGRDTTAADAEAKKVRDKQKELLSQSVYDRVKAIEDEQLEISKGLKAESDEYVKYWEEAKKIQQAGIAESLTAFYDDLNKQELAKAEAFDKEKQVNEAKLKATRDIYSDIRGEEKAYYQASLNLIEQQAAEFREAQVDEVAIAVWKANELDKLNQKMAMSSDSLVDGIKAGYKDLEKDQIRWGKVGYDTFKATHQGMARTFSDVFEDAYKGDLKDVGDYAGSIWDSTRRKFFDVAAEMAAEKVELFFKTSWTSDGANVLGIINSVLGIAGDLFGGSPGVGGVSGGTATAGGYSGGSYAGFAKGGQMPAGKPAWVGEEGPELIFPTSAGYVLPHKESMAYAAKHGGNIPGFADGGPILPGVMMPEDYYGFIRALGWKDITGTGQWIDPTGFAPLPMRFMTPWGSVTPQEAALTFDPTEYGYAAGVRAMEVRPDVGYISHDTGTNMPLVAQIVDAALSIAVPAWGIVSGIAKAGMGAGTGNNAQLIAGIMQAGLSGYAAYNVGAGGYADAGLDVSGVGMGGAGEGATWFTARQALLAAASPAVKSAVINQTIGMMAKAFGGGSPSASVEYAGYNDNGMLAMLSESLHGIAPKEYRVPAYEKGTDYVPRTGLALLHEGEQVVPKGQGGGFNGVIKIYLDGQEIPGRVRIISDEVVVERNRRGVNPTQRAYS